MAMSRAGIGGWREETGSLSRAGINGWREESQGAAADSITITNPGTYKFFEGAAGSGLVTVSGSHTGATSDIQVQIETAEAAVVVAWTTLDDVAPAGAFTGSVSVPRGGPYLARVRKAANTSIEALGTTQILVGYIVGMMGQSHVPNFQTNGTGTPNARAFVHNGTSLAQITSTGEGQNALTNAIIAAANCPVCFVGYGVSGAPLSYFWATSKQSSYTTWESRVASIAPGKLSHFVWWQGEGNLGDAKETYRSAVAAMFAQLRADYGSTLPITVVQLGRNTAGTSNDADYEKIRDAQIDLGNDANCSLVSAMDFALADGVHFLSSASAIAGQRIAQCALKAKGDAAYSRGPRIQRAILDGAAINVELIHDGGTDFTPTTGITGFRVLDNGTPATISSAVRVSATRVRLTLSAVPAGPVLVQYGYGKQPDITGLLRDNTGLALPLETTDADVSPVPMKRVVLTCIQRVGGAAAASVTGLRYAFFDQSAPNALTAPVVTGTGESTDGSGVLEIEVIDSTLAVGATGYLVTDTAAGVGFAGPVVVSG